MRGRGRAGRWGEAQGWRRARGSRTSGALGCVTLEVKRSRDTGGRQGLRPVKARDGYREEAHTRGRGQLPLPAEGRRKCRCDKEAAHFLSGRWYAAVLSVRYSLHGTQHTPAHIFRCQSLRPRHSPTWLALCSPLRQPPWPSWASPRSLLSRCPVALRCRLASWARAVYVGHMRHTILLDRRGPPSKRHAAGPVADPPLIAPGQDPDFHLCLPSLCFIGRI